MTDLRVTQVGVEAWQQNDSDLRVTQVGNEVWYVIQPSALLVTQVGVEVWCSVADAPRGGPRLIWWE